MLRPTMRAHALLRARPPLTLRRQPLVLHPTSTVPASASASASPSFTSRVPAPLRPASLRCFATASETKGPTKIEEAEEADAGPTPREQLHRVAEMIERVGATNGNKAKIAIVKEYPDLREMLAHVLDTKGTGTFDLSVSGFEKYLRDAYARMPPEQRDRTPEPNLLSMFRVLSRRRLVGHAARAAVVQFLIHHGIMTNENDTKNPEYLVFGRLLDRKLNCGLNYTSFAKVDWGDLPGMAPPSSSAAPDEETGPPPTARRGRKPRAMLDEAAEQALEQEAASAPMKVFSVALGKSVEPPFQRVFGGGEWYASRKLDGVRCLTYLDFAVPQNTGEPWLVDVRFHSRHGNQFSSLENLASDIRRNLRGFPGLRQLVLRDAADGDEGRRRLVLDGEVCVMRRLTPEEAAKVDHGTAGPLWEDDGLTEDFRATVSQVKRKYDAVPFPAYFLFDAVPWSEFAGTTKKGARRFAERQKDVQELGKWLARDKETESRGLVRALLQEKVQSREALDAMVERAAKEGWEGLILRKNEMYKGSRTSDVLKYKQWQDAEYEVVGIETSKQRLSVNGQYAEHEALAAVIVEHKGHRVAVGSGFTTLQRLRYCNPDHIVGKAITVEYFGESTVPGREGTSLRFPRVKTVWEGRRDV